MRLLLVMTVLLLTSPARGLDGRCWEEVSPQGLIKHCGDHRPPVPHHHTQEAHREDAHREDPHPKPKPHVARRRAAPSYAVPSYEAYPWSANQ
jgi:hypothetical protein